MTEQEMNSYRFNSGKEPTDEMLAQIMHEVAQEAAEKHKKAEARYFAELRKLVEETQALWKDRIEAAING